MTIMPAPKKYISLAIVGFFVLIITQIWASNNVAAYGEKLEKLGVLTKALILENQTLENQIATSAALRNIASQSAELGFGQPESIQYIR